jgi:hypothetical protein
VGNIKIHGLDRVGVVVDDSPLGSAEGQLTKAQNAIAEPLGEKGAIRKRPGLGKFNASAANGQVQGGVGIPIFLGSAGPDFQNPFIDTGVTAVGYYTPKYRVRDPRKGADFDDDSFDIPIFDLDSEDEPDEDDEPTTEETEDPSQPIDPATDEVLAPSTLFPLTILGESTTWLISLNVLMTEHLISTDTFDNAPSLLFPITSLRTDSPLTDWHTGGSTSALRGRPMAGVNGALFYAEEGD